MKINEPIERELNHHFPKGDKARGKALVINAIANIELDKLKQQHEKELKKVRDAKNNELSKKRNLHERYDKLIKGHYLLQKENQKLKKELEDLKEIIKGIGVKNITKEMDKLGLFKQKLKENTNNEK